MLFDFAIVSFHVPNIKLFREKPLYSSLNFIGNLCTKFDTGCYKYLILIINHQLNNEF